MARIKRGVSGIKHRRKVMKLVKGFRARAAAITASRTKRCCIRWGAYRDRRVRKRDFRSLWIARINAAARREGLSYSRLIAGLKKSGVVVNRKVLADLAVHDQAAFGQLLETAKKAVGVTTAA